MQELTDMRWILDQLTSRRMNDVTIKSADGFAAIFLDHALRTGASIDNDYIARNSMELAKTMLHTYVENKLI